MQTMTSYNVYLVLLPLATVLLAGADGEGSCHNGWLSFRNSCYLFSREVENWAEANFNCQLFHSELVDITDADENHFLISQLLRLHKNDPNKNAMCYLTSGTDTHVEGEWEWANTGAMMTFTDWYPGEPNNHYFNDEVENCLCLYGGHTFHWNDDPCDLPNHFICRAKQASHNSD